MSEPIVVHLICPQCAAPLQPDDHHCAKCGADVTVDDEATVGADRGKDGSLSTLLHNRWAILGLLFLVLAAFGLPLLWKSRVFSLPMKLILTIVVLLYTALIIWLIFLVLQSVVEQWRVLWSALKEA